MIENLGGVELKEILKQLKIYKELKTKLGNRGTVIYKNSLDNIKSLVVEYSSSTNKDFALEQSISIYKNIFNIEVSNSDIKLIENKDLIGGIKVFCEDNMIDLTFLKYQKILSK
ncbi:MAG: hypothetical protein NWP80_00310 [Candidatus Gracilibacteria bacterium]|nr:hypothetical protein [Candidatus Gracilibacteria bacterium]